MRAGFLIFSLRERIRKRVADVKLSTNTSSLPDSLLLIELGLAGRENIWLSLRTCGPSAERSVRPDIQLNIF